METASLQAEEPVIAAGTIGTRTRAIVGVLLVALTATSAFAAQNAVVTLRFEPDHFLLGLDAMVSVSSKLRAGWSWR